MTATLWLRISAAIELLFAIGHTLGGLKNWSPMGETEVLRAMRQVHFDALGVNRSYLDFYLAFGYSISVTMVVQAILLWQIGDLVITDARRARSMIAAIATSVLICAIIAWRLLFPVPAIFSLLLAASLIISFILAHPKSR